MELNQKLTEKGQRDYKLVKLALGSGDQDAYAELMNLYRDSLYFTMLKMTNNPHDAEDLTIEAFGKAFKYLPQYTSEFAFSTWLFKIATNNCIDFMRRKRRGNFTVNTGFNEDDMSAQVVTMTANPEEEIINKQKIHLMQQVVKRLKPHYKKIIKMRYFMEYSYDEIAEELDLPLGTVKAQLFRAREFLFNILKHSKEKI